MKKLLCICVLFFSFYSNAQTITTYAGGGSSNPGNGGPATAALLGGNPVGGFFDKYGNYYFVDGLRLRKITPSGIITTLAGIGMNGFSGDGGPATAAKLSTPQGVALDTSGNIFIVDHGNMRIRRIDAATGIINTIAGTGVLASTGDGGAATAATLGNPQDICIDKHGNIYIAEFFSDRVRKINTAGIISNFAGRNGVIGYSGDGSRADTAKIGALYGLCIDIVGNVYIADNSNSSVYKVDTFGIIRKVAGTSLGNYVYNGDEIPATTANIDPVRIGIDKFGNLFIADEFNFRVRMVDNLGKIHTVDGIGTTGFSGDGGPASAAQFNFPAGIAFDSCSNLYIPDNGNNRVRKITYPHCNYLGVAASLLPSEGSQQVCLYPNPVIAELTIANVKEDGSYKLLNTVGAEVQQGIIKAGNSNISMERLPTGMYLLEMCNEKGQKSVSRVVKD